MPMEGRSLAGQDIGAGLTGESLSALKGSSDSSDASSSDVGPEDSIVTTPSSYAPKRMRWCFIAVANFVALLLCVSLLFDDPKQAYQSFFSEKNLHANMITLTYAFGLLFVAVEDRTNINKSAVMLVTSTAMWTVHATSGRYAANLEHEETKEVQAVGTVVLFVLPAMACVELIDHFHGYALVTRLITRLMGRHERRLLPLITVMTFFLCSVNDNLTSTLVALKIIRHVAVEDEQWRRACAGMVVIAANAGGTWSPVFDVSTVLEPTTGILWTRNKVTAIGCAKWLFLPSLVSMLTPMFGILWQSPPRRRGRGTPAPEALTPTSRLVFAVGVLGTLFVPLLKFSLSLPAYVAMMLVLGFLWLVSESRLVVPPKGKHGFHSAVEAALHKVDLTGLLFFVGMLLAVGLLTHCGILRQTASLLIRVCGQSRVAMCSLLGLTSALADSTSLIDEAMDVYTGQPRDHPVWQLAALAGSTGSSLTSFGSLAGVALMSTENVSFLWYLQWVTPWAALGFSAGIATYQAQRLLIG